MQKVNRLLKAVPTYIERYRHDPTLLITEQHMSDADSGPEDENEQRAEWKLRMAEKYGIADPQPVAIEKMKFLEVIAPEWRSDKERTAYQLSFNFALRPSNSLQMSCTSFARSGGKVCRSRKRKRLAARLCTELVDQHLSHRYKHLTTLESTRPGGRYSNISIPSM